jgi:hypothetical protein
MEILCVAGTRSWVVCAKIPREGGSEPAAQPPSAAGDVSTARGACKTRPVQAIGQFASLTVKTHPHLFV